jgi:hypothetical protein
MTLDGEDEVKVLSSVRGINTCSITTTAYAYKNVDSAFD